MARNLMTSQGRSCFVVSRQMWITLSIMTVILFSLYIMTSVSARPSDRTSSDIKSVSLSSSMRHLHRRNSISGGSPLAPNDVHSADSSNGRGYIPGGSKGQRSARSSISRSRTPSESSEVSTSEKDPKDRLHLDQTRNSVSPAKTKPDIAEESDEEQGEIEVHHTPPSSPEPHPANGYRIETMFSKMSVSFMDIKLDKDGGIPVEAFLEACDNVLLIFDKLSPTAFSPIKMDISGNVKKIRQKYSTDREHFATLQKVISYEVNHEQHKNGNSATISLVWLKRAMMFIREFLAEVHAGEVELEDCAYNAYQRTLRQFHGFVIRGVFAVAVKSVPYRKDFLIALVHLPEDVQKAGYVDQVLSDIDDYVTAQGVLIKIIDDYLTSQGIDIKTVV